MEAARSLSLVATPTGDTVQSLKDLRTDPTVGAQATFGLGSALHRLQEQDPTLACLPRWASAQSQSPEQHQAGPLFAGDSKSARPPLKAVRIEALLTGALAEPFGGGHSLGDWGYGLILAFGAGWKTITIGLDGVFTKWGASTKPLAVRLGD
ncbi:MAG: hypothetical protein M3O36_17140 [Myxococcota bacterium]|nr:hypothetical protein [Myxococcota bacterium]